MPRSNNLEFGPLQTTQDVKLGGRKVGQIRGNAKDGWQYFPKGCKTGGVVYPSLADCQKVLGWE